VLNLPSVAEVGHVDRLARTTGSDPVPPHKVAMGYRFEKDKLRVGELTAVPSDLVAPPRLLECPVHLEATLAGVHPIAANEPDRAGKLIALEVRIQRVHIDEEVLMGGHRDRIDPDKWRPLIMSFCHFYGLGAKLYESELAKIPESAYRYAPPPAPVQSPEVRLA
jgi:flavin reductase (DIM6/NTAB) family NADH-FMN oxidoreductase RutF